MSLQSPDLTAKMYGLLLQNLKEYVVKIYGAKKWNEVAESFKMTVSYLFLFIDGSVGHCDAWFSSLMTLMS